MPNGKPSGGRGSNQYQTRGTPSPPPGKRGAVAAAAQELEDVAWGFHPDRAAWERAGFDPAEAQEWVRHGGIVGDADTWRDITRVTEQLDTILFDMGSEPVTFMYAVTVTNYTTGEDGYAVTRTTDEAVECLHRYVTDRWEDPTFTPWLDDQRRRARPPAKVATGQYFERSRDDARISAVHVPTRLVERGQFTMLIIAGENGTEYEFCENPADCRQALRLYVLERWDDEMEQDGEPTPDPPDDVDDMIAMFFDSSSQDHRIVDITLDQ